MITGLIEVYIVGFIGSDCSPYIFKSSYIVGLIWFDSRTSHVNFTLETKKVLWAYGDSRVTAKSGP